MIPLRDSQPSYSKPVVTTLLVAANVLIFLFQISLDPFTRNDFVFHYGLVADRFHWINVLTSMFLHGGWMHLIGNMMFLWVFGDNVEDALGRGKFLLFYLGCGAAAALAQVAISPYSRVPMVGASGAIAGVMGAYLIKFPRARVVTLIPVFVFLTTMEIPAAFLLLYWFVLQFFSGVGSIADSHAARGGVAFFAHIGGFVAGMALSKLIKGRDRYRVRGDVSW